MLRERNYGVDLQGKDVKRRWVNDIRRIAMYTTSPQSRRDGMHVRHSSSDTQTKSSPCIGCEKKTSIFTIRKSNNYFTNLQTLRPFQQHRHHKSRALAPELGRPLRALLDILLAHRRPRALDRLHEILEHQGGLEQLIGVDFRPGHFNGAGVAGGAGG